MHSCMIGRCFTRYAANVGRAVNANNYTVVSLITKFIVYCSIYISIEYAQKA